MTIITAKQNGSEYSATATDWMASFLDFQINKLEERYEEVRTTMDAKLPKSVGDPIWN